MKVSRVLGQAERARKLFVKDAMLSRLHEINGLRGGLEVDVRQVRSGARTVRPGTRSGRLARVVGAQRRAQARRNAQHAREARGAAPGDRQVGPSLAIALHR